MKRITNREKCSVSIHCERCSSLTRVLYTVTDETGAKEFLCEDCVGKDDTIE